MKRSRITGIMTEVDALMRHYGLSLLPFAYWGLDAFVAKIYIGKGRAPINFLAGVYSKWRW